MNASSIAGIDSVQQRPLPLIQPRYAAAASVRRPRRERCSPGSRVVEHPAAEAPEPSIDTIIARYVDANPPQLYRGGA